MYGFKKRMLIGLLVAACGCVSAAYGQMSAVYGVKFETSFPFAVGKTVLPAGDYTVRRLPGADQSRYSLLLQGRNGENIMLNTVGAKSKGFLNRSELVFEDIDGQYFLTEVRQAGEEAGNRIPVTPARMRIARNHHEVVIPAAGP